MKLSLLWSLLLVNGVCIVASDSGPSSPIPRPPWSTQYDQMQPVESRQQPEPPPSPVGKVNTPNMPPVFESAMLSLAKPGDVIGLAYYNDGTKIHPQPSPYYRSGDLKTVCHDMSQLLNADGITYLPIATHIVPSEKSGSPSQILLICGGKYNRDRNTVQSTDWTRYPFQVRIVCYDQKYKWYLEPHKSSAIERYYTLSTGYSMPVDTDCPYSQALTMDITPAIQNDETIDPQSLAHKIGVVKYFDNLGRVVTASYQYGGDLDTLCEQIRGSNGVAQVQLRSNIRNPPYLLVDCKGNRPKTSTSLYLQCFHIHAESALGRSFTPFGETDYERAQPWVEQFYNNVNVKYDCPGSIAYTDVIGQVNNLLNPQYYFRSQDLDTFCASLSRQQGSKFGHETDDQYEAVSSKGSPSLGQGFDLQCAQGIWTRSGSKQVSSLEVNVQCVNFGMNALDGLDRLHVGSLSPLEIASYYQQKDAANLQHSIRRLGVFKDCSGGQAHQKLSVKLYEAMHRPEYMPPSPFSSGSSQSFSPSFSEPHQAHSPMFSEVGADRTPPRTMRERFQGVSQGVKQGWNRVFNLRTANAPSIGIITRPSVKGKGGLTIQYRADQDLNDVCNKLYGGSPRATNIATLFNSDPKKQQFEIKLTCAFANSEATANIECFTGAGSVRINPILASSLGNYYNRPLDDCPGGLAEQAVAARLAGTLPVNQNSGLSPPQSSQRVSGVGSSNQSPPDPWEQAAAADQFHTPSPEIKEEPYPPNIPPMGQTSASQYSSAVQSPSQWSEVSEQVANADRMQTPSPEIREEPYIPNTPSHPPNQDVPIPPKKSWWSRPWSRQRNNQMANLQGSLQQGQPL